jgi:hypothetical protein
MAGLDGMKHRYRDGTPYGALSWPRDVVWQKGNIVFATHACYGGHGRSACSCGQAATLAERMWQRCVPPRSYLAADIKAFLFLLMAQKETNTVSSGPVTEGTPTSTNTLQCQDTSIECFSRKVLRYAQTFAEYRGPRQTWLLEVVNSRVYATFNATFIFPLLLQQDLQMVAVSYSCIQLPVTMV